MPESDGVITNSKTLPYCTRVLSYYYSKMFLNLGTGTYHRISTEPFTITTNTHCWLQDQRTQLIGVLARSRDIFGNFNMAELTLAGMFVGLYKC